MKNLNKLCKFSPVFLLSVLTIFTILANCKHEQQLSKKQREEQNKYQHSMSPKYSVPFLILMSDDEICVAQLPLIDNGIVSVAYRLTGGSATEKEEESNWSSSSSSISTSSSRVAPGPSSTTTTDADAREYEQMPRESTSLGKSEWQQIGSNSKSVPDGRDREEVGAGITEDAHEELKKGSSKEVSRPRRSSNNLVVDDADEASKSTSITNSNSNRNRSGRDGNNNNNSNDIAVLESSSTSNVTSAQFGNSPEEITNIASQLQTSGSTLITAEDDKSVGNGGTVRFSDFDVHMSRGYAFVADSRGRIHRFRLSGFEKVEVPTENWMEHFYTNVVDAVDSSSSASFSDSSQSSSLVKPATGIGSKIFAHLNSTLDGASSVAPDDDANKVDAGQRDNVTHEQSGRHPTVSGKEVLTTLSGGSGDAPTSDSTSSSLVNQVSTKQSRIMNSGLEFDFSKSSFSALQNMILDGSGESRALAENELISFNKFNSTTANHTSTNDDLLIVSNNFTHNSNQTLAQKKQHRVAEASKPRIIWSRNRLDASDAGLPKQQSHTPLEKWALPLGSNHQSELNGNEFNQVVGVKHMESGVAENDNEQSSSDGKHHHKMQSESGQSGGDVEQTTDSHNNFTIPSNHSKLTPGSHPSTEIAVDWLNNLLFVLDNYRLVVIDFDGNNELVLIDDFSANNRPIDIKVDPVNDFLFWLQVGTFHNTIYKLDLNVLSMPTERLLANTAKLGQTSRNIEAQDSSSSELVALISHHYAHPIITNLPQHVRIFTIDHKHSRIYVPLAPRNGGDGGFDQNRTRDDTEVFGSTDELNAITHMNSTTEHSTDSAPIDEESKNCSTTETSSSLGQILAYNLDGTDVGPLRSIGEKSHLTNLDDMQDITVDSDKGYLYWLTNDGKELFEEYKTERDSSFYSAQHNLNGKKYSKLMHFGLNQPTHIKPRFNLRRLIHMLSSSTSTNRWTRSDNREQVEENVSASSLNGRHRPGSESDASRFSREAPYIILAITCLGVIIIYLVYTFIFQQIERHSIGGSITHCREGSIGSSSAGDSQVDCDATTNGFLGASTISRWIVKPSNRSTESPSYNRDTSSNGRLESCDIESNNYDTSNAIDEHYREVLREHSLFNFSPNRLANLSEWPTNLNDLSNKLYVPVEVLQDEALSSIRRITIDQLEIERKAPLGEGHFGTVLQGTITCSSSEKNYLMNRSQTVAINVPSNVIPPSPNTTQSKRTAHPSSTSSGHGSSSTSSEFITASSCAEAPNGDYLTPKSQCNSAVTDYDLENQVGSNSNNSYYKEGANQTAPKGEHSVELSEMKLKVAIKKLKDNASREEKRDFLQEAKLLANFDHPNIVHLIGICLDRGSTLLVMELMLGGDLIRYMQENTPRFNSSDNLTFEDLLKICLDIVNGCCYLEEHDYIHRDLAARNCLVSSRKKEERVVKLADFGLARDIYGDSYYKKVNDSAMPLKWMAPECLIEQKFTTMSDVWSFGVVMWEVMSFCQEKPYGNMEAFLMKDHLASGKRLNKPAICNDDVYKLMRDCWQFESNKRPTFQECRAVLIQIKSTLEGTVK